MKNKLKKLLYVFLSIVFWLAVWQSAALIVNQPFFLPTISETLSALFKAASSYTFYMVVFLTFLRVITGLLLGVIAGIILAIASHHVKIIRSLVSPIVSVIKATPVATFIIILYVNMKNDALTIFIGFLMVMPIIWQNLIDAYDSIDKELIEVCELYDFSFKKKMKVLVLPAFLNYLLPGLVTATGLAWKSEVAAEIIAYTTNSIGQHMNMAQYANDTPTMFAWTLVIIVISILLEKGMKALLSRRKI
jgi:NitT/TauT family transport system permease protein